jgi:2-amino-4-hydroxy-6-hydroxymethyldihydropteridine diphosphokinase
MTAFLSLGGNLGNTREIFEQTYLLIEKKIGRICKKSHLYQTAAWGLTEQADFLNQVIEVETNNKPEEILAHLLQIEHELGRVRDVRWGPRRIDLDLLFVDDLVVNSAQLTLPHPHIQDRKFILIPLAEIAPNVIHPQLKRTAQELLNSTLDDGPVEIIRHP